MKYAYYWAQSEAIPKTKPKGVVGPSSNKALRRAEAEKASRAIWEKEVEDYNRLMDRLSRCPYSLVSTPDEGTSFLKIGEQ